MKRYEVQLICRVTEISENGTRQDLLLPNGPTWNVPRTGLVAIEQLMLGVLNKIGSWGYNHLSVEEKKEVDQMVG